MKKPKIIIWDIETLPNLQKALENWTNLDCQWKKVTMTRTVSSLACVGWKELGKKKIHCVNAWDFPKRWKNDKNDDYEVAKAMYEVLHDADGIITQNGVKFDYKFLQTALFMNDLPLLPKIPHIDTKTLASRNLTIVNNRLNSIADACQVGQKMQNGGWQLWVDTHAGKKKALKTMTDYCKQDVKLTEEVFLKLMPFAKNIPNYNMFTGKDLKASRACPSCGSDRLHKHSTVRTKTNAFQRYKCYDCGSYSRTNTKDERPVST